MDIDPHSLIPHLSPYFRPPAEFNHSGFSGGQFPPKVNNKKKTLYGQSLCTYLSRATFLFSARFENFNRSIWRVLERYQRQLIRCVSLM
jgi:hypothetical protein